MLRHESYSRLNCCFSSFVIANDVPIKSNELPKIEVMQICFIMFFIVNHLSNYEYSTEMLASIRAIFVIFQSVESRIVDSTMDSSDGGK